jgi:hypothetical protein
MDIQAANHVLTKAILGIEEGEAAALREEVLTEESGVHTERVMYDGKFVTPTARLRWNAHQWHLEELPQKGKKKLKVATMQNPGGLFRGSMARGADYFLPVNILRDARLASSDTYEKVKAKVFGAYKKALTDLKKDHGEWLDSNSWVTKMKWDEGAVHYLKVTPEGMEPIVAQGKDFRVTSEWDEFKAYSPGSDFQSHDPHYTQLHQKSAAAARKLYKILRADPNILRSVPFAKFADWLGKKKVAYSYHFSQWR